MINKLLFLFSVAFGYSLFAQTNPITFYSTNDDLNHQSGEIVAVSNNQLFGLYSRNFYPGRIQYFLSKSSNSGTTWDIPYLLFDTTVTTLAMEDSLATPFLVRAANNRLLAIFKVGSGIYKYKISEDGGGSWGISRHLKLLANINLEGTLKITSAIYNGENEIVLAISQSQNSIGFSKSTDNGNTFSEYQILTTAGFTNSTLLPSGSGNMILISQEKNVANKKLMMMKYLASTGKWYDTTVVANSVNEIRNPKLYKDTQGNLHIFYREIKYAIGGFRNSDYFRISSSDNGVTWQTPVQLTRYKGDDANLNINPQSVSPIIVFSGLRYSANGKTRLWFGDGLTMGDIAAPPVIYSTKMLPAVPALGDSIFFLVYAGYHQAGLNGKIIGTINELPVEFNLYDDGLHNDSTANDGIFKGFAKIASPGDYGRLTVQMTGGPYSISSAEFTFAFLINGVAAMDGFSTGRLWVPFDRNGVIADVTIDGKSSLRYDSIPVIFSNGFSLSGIKDGAVWSASVMSASRIDDYQTGPAGVLPEDPRNGIYRVAIQDSVFGTSWQLWKYAVQTGARYWDGNHNGIYDPIDLNNNGTWEPNEDMPEILGEISYYCVYNDGVPKEQRRFTEIPAGIEIRQTIYAFPNSPMEAVKDAIFIRYEIVNKGTVTPEISDAFFSAWTDTDLGDYTDDLFCTDSLRNSSFIYNDGNDAQFGVNPPAVFQTILFGEPVFIPGISFHDLNGNSIYDPGVDVALDTAIIPMGKPFQNKKIPGASNLGLTSSQHYMSSHPTHGDPNYSVELRNYQQGKQKTGLSIDPCTWGFGQFYGGIPCSTASKIFVYSGDPVTNSGWLNNTPTDQRSMANSGPFNLAMGDTVTFHNAIVVGRGTDQLNSVTVTKARIDEIFTHFGAKYHYYPTGLDEKEFLVPQEFALWQNYPNPFNPETTIKFSLMERSNATLSVYTISGEKIADISSGVMEKGIYEKRFDGSKLSSGVYIFRLNAQTLTSESGNFTKTIKAVLMK